MPRVLLTGGSGFIGQALLARLLEHGDEVVALARSDAAAEALAGRGAEVARGDVLDEGALARAMHGCALVYHVAGINTMCPDDPLALFHVNVRGAELTVRAAGRAGVRRVVLTSSAAALGEAHGTVGREDSPHRGDFLSVYERSKHEGEQAALAAAVPAGVEVVAVNPSSVQGPGRSGGTGRILIAYLNGRLKAFVDTTISLVDIDDAVEGHLLAAEKGVPGERYVLCGAAMESPEALAEVSALTGVADRVRMLPAPLARAAGAAAEAAYRVRGRTPPVCREMVRTLLHGHRYDGSRATRELGLHYTPARETFRRTIAWALEEGLITRPLPGWESGVPRTETDRRGTDGPR
jgi:dihydroflavonol-4-reductase